MIVNPASVHPGDVILIFTKGKRARINIVGQSVMRLRRILTGTYRQSRYSHVMLGVSAGIVVHADGHSVKVERLTDAIRGDQMASGNLLVMRPAHPALQESDGLRIVQEALTFLQQTYSFIPGRKSTWLGRIIHRKRPLTHPFCSELVAAAFAAIGRPITDLPPDRVRPVDLEMYCTPPAWRDVTDEYVAEHGHSALDDVAIDVAGRVLALPSFFRETDQLLEKAWGHDTQQTNLVYQASVSIVHACGLIQQLRSMELDLSKKLALRRLLLFTSYISICHADLLCLQSFYDAIRAGIFGNATPLSDALSQVLHNIPSDKRAYEALPSVDSLREFELLGASLAFGARALRLQAALSAIAVTSGITIKGEQSIEGLTKQMIEPVVRYIFQFPQTEMDELLGRIAAITIPSDSTYTEDVRRVCSNVVRLHAVLSLLYHGAEKKPGVC